MKNKIININQFREILKGSDSPVLLIGSGYEYMIGYQAYYDYKPTRHPVGSHILECSSLSDIFIERYSYTIKLLEKDIFETLITTSPYCIYRCLNLNNDIIDRIIPITGCIECVDCLFNQPKHVGLGDKLNMRIFAGSLLVLTTADLLVIAGLTPTLSPVNMFPLVARYCNAKIVVIDTSYNPYMNIADYIIYSSPYRVFRELYGNF
jgi:hypothetical protein